jgi:hypothetical protein
LNSGSFVQKQNSPMRKAHFSWLGVGSAAINAMSLQEWCGLRRALVVRMPFRKYLLSQLRCVSWSPPSSSRFSSGKMVGTRLASMVFPLPGGPIISRCVHPPQLLPKLVHLKLAFTSCISRGSRLKPGKSCLYPQWLAGSPVHASARRCILAGWLTGITLFPR